MRETPSIKPPSEMASSENRPKSASIDNQAKENTKSDSRKIDSGFISANNFRALVRVADISTAIVLPTVDVRQCFVF